MYKKFLIAVLSLAATASVMAQERSLNGDAVIEDARINTYYGIEKFILTFPTTTNTALTDACGGVSKTYGGNSTNPNHKIAVLNNFKAICGNTPTKVLQIKWKRVDTDAWTIKNFILPPAGPNPDCMPNIKLTDGAVPETPYFTVTYNSGCGTQ